jgi:hypothetical protein
LRFRSPLLTQSIVFFLFLRLLRCFTSPGIAFFSLSSSPSPVSLPLRAVFRCRFGFRKSHAGITLHRLPHSEISGSSLMCSSPKLIAACHVLLRLLEPRHSLCALISLILLLIFYPVSRDFHHDHLQSSFAVFPKIKSDCFLRSSRDQEIVSFFIILYAVVKELGGTLGFAGVRSFTGNGLRVVFDALKGNFWRWWALLDSNQRPPPYQGGALTN